jgi:hypothetical protein
MIQIKHNSVIKKAFRFRKAFCYLLLVRDMHSYKIVGYFLRGSLELSGFVNGILKDEFYLNQLFTDGQHTKRAAKNAINLYNEIRLHLSLDYKTPNRVYLPDR